MNGIIKYTRQLHQVCRPINNPQVRTLMLSQCLKESVKVKAKSGTAFRIFKVVGFGTVALTSTIGLYGLYKMKAYDTSIAPNEEFLLAETPPSLKIARSIVNPADNSGLKLTLYQFQTCPFCCKVRAFLDYFGFSYDVIEVNSVMRQQTKWSKYKKVPFLLVEHQESGKAVQLKDSTVIISILLSILTNQNMTLKEAVEGYPVAQYTNKDDGSWIPSKKTIFMNRYFLMNYALPKNRTKEDMALERKWRRWADDVYIHMLSPNVYRTLEESFQAFSWFSKVGNWEELFTNSERLLVVYSGSLVMYLIGKRLKKRHNLKEDVRDSLYVESNVWLRAIKQAGGSFMGGDEPNLSDLAVYGVLTAIEGCDAFKDLMDNTKMNDWYSLMKNEVSGHHGSKRLSERGRISIL